METQQIAKLNAAVSSVITSDGLQGFQKAYLIADATGKLKQYLNPEFMKPIMELQNNRLGFKTDKPDGGYPESVVKNCLIEAVLTGVQPFGNQFNIIAGNCYITKEGFGHLLSNIPGLVYEIIPSLPRITDKSAAIVMRIEWTHKGEKKNRDIDFPIKVNQYMGADAVIGKATRKARAWLFSTITGVEIGDGDVSDTEVKVVSSKISTPTPTLDDLNNLVNQKMDLLNKSEFENAKRIINDKDENSYQKLFDLLTSKGA
jgi:hypothetical protein